MKLSEMYEDVYARLTGQPGLIALLGGDKVFDFMPGDDTPGPYIVLGDTWDTEGRVMSDEERRIEVRLDIWSSYRGRAQVLGIEQEVEKALCGPDKPYIFESFQVLRDDDWTHGVVTFRAYLDNLGG